MADAVIEGRKRFLSYLSQEGVTLKEEEKKTETQEEPLVLPEEEVKIKEIEEIVEADEPVEGETRPTKKGRPGATSEDKTKSRKRP
jgi:hypothetical protein